MDYSFPFLMKITKKNRI